MSSLDKSGSKSFLSVQTIVLAQVAWAVLALLFFLLFSVTPKGQEPPTWYSLGTSIFEATAYLVAFLLCFRNWRSPQIVSGRNVWLCIGLGMLFYFLGNLLFTYWELGLGLEAAVSPGDFFFILTYIFLVLGLWQAVSSRRLNLEIWQKGVVVGIGAIGIALAIWLGSSAPQEPDKTAFFLESPVYAQAAPATKPSVKSAPAAKPAASAQPASTTPATSPIVASPNSAKADATEGKSNSPQWAIDLENALKPFKDPVNLFYQVCDVILLVLATALLLAFWGGRFSQSWRMIAFAAFCLYVADIWFKYANDHIPEYKSGSLPEVGWVFCGVLFGIGAALEYDLSSRSRRGSSRRRA
ncbi:MAG TPA: hypothetical protein V6C64_00370 [Microcoleaceae cyanobacterium]|jgi:hypothetical protein